MWQTIRKEKLPEPYHPCTNSQLCKLQLQPWVWFSQRFRKHVLKTRQQRGQQRRGRSQVWFNTPMSPSTLVHRPCTCVWTHTHILPWNGVKQNRRRAGRPSLALSVASNGKSWTHTHTPFPVESPGQETPRMLWGQTTPAASHTTAKGHSHSLLLIVANKSNG